MIMTTEMLIQLLELLSGVAILVLFFRYPWQSILVDMTRQRLFEIRDDIFIYAADGRINFNSKVYGSLRDRLNSSIRYCHKVSFSTVMAAVAVQDEPAKPQRQEKSLLDIVSDIEDADLRNDLEKKAIEATLFLAALMILRSPVLLLLSTLLFPLLLIYELLSGHIKKCISVVGTIIEKDISYEEHTMGINHFKNC